MGSYANVSHLFHSGEFYGIVKRTQAQQGHKTQESVVVVVVAASSLKSVRRVPAFKSFVYAK